MVLNVGIQNTYVEQEVAAPGPSRGASLPTTPQHLDSRPLAAQSVNLSTEDLTSMTIHMPGEGNSVDIDPDIANSNLSTIIIRGYGNRVRIGKCFHFSNVYIEASNGAVIDIDDDCNLGGLRIHALAPGASIHIGRGSSFNGAPQITAHEPSNITIGSGCLFAHGVSIASSDVHKIFDVETATRTNPPADIVIGDRVWVAANVSILKSSVISHDSVVGCDSQVRGQFPSNVLIAGIPAKIVRSGIRWEM